MPNVLITGTSKGIGLAAEAELRARGCTVVGHSTHGGDGRIAADLSVPGAAEALWAAALEQLGGRVDVLVNNAGVFTDAPIDGDAEAFRAEWLRTMQINLFAAADLCRLALVHFRSRSGGGRLVNLGSRAAHRGDGPPNAHYAASKAAMTAMTKTYARAHAGQGILAFTVAPGFVMTGMAEEYLASRGGAGVLADIPLGRVAETDEVAKVIAFCALDAPPSMTGATIDINGASYVR
ncbi:MAG: SDR family oxidoreductase [Sphingomonadaceae bacterium]|nr:SDR family oxidoreductase [Sphingomonadaceae bacterium]